MNKIYTLENGLKVVFYQDKTKHIVMANLFVKFGGNNKKFYSDQEYTIKNGTAHFIEHLLIEHSIYGNSMTEFEKNNTISNGFTTKDTTEFYVNIVNDYLKEIEKLINIVNNPCFKKEDIEETRKAIIKEKMMSKDNYFAELDKINYECLFKNIKYPNILGEVKDIEKISYEEIKKCYETFYQPKNQILIISGNFNIEKVEELIEKTYKKLNKPNIDYQIEKIKEENKIVKNYSFIKKDVNMDYVSINYKINIEKYKKIKLLNLMSYISYFLDTIFGPTSKLYSELVKNNICSYNINYNFDIIDKFLIIKVGNYTNKDKEFIKYINEEINKRKVDKEMFLIKQKQSIIRLILREDSLFSMLEPFIENIIEYDYYKMDKIKDIEKLTFEEYSKKINELDFSNYCITKIIKEDS